ncbi:hypothetical protein JL721_9199 [Aureococcus anophagefferens]|nr:hypothetical protein JL721_9199 [Aureococcus anophagefferens]
MKWFGALAGEMARLDDDEAHATMMGRKIQTLVGALEEVEQFEQVDTNLQIKAFLADTREFLLQMVRITNVQHSVMHVIESVSDLSYAFDILGDYVPILHDRCNSSDQASVASYYSTELVNFVRRVLDVIPVSVFGLLDDIVDIQTRTLAPLPVKLETAYLKDYAQLNERYQLARLTHQVHEILAHLGRRVDGYRRSVEYVQDYIDIAGLKMWQEELGRVVNYNVEAECNRYLRRKVHDLSNFVDDYKALTAPHARFLESLRDALFPEWAPPRGGGGPGKLCAAKTLEAAMPRLLHRILAVGHAQLLRKSLNHALLLKARVDADFLHASLTNVDGAVLGDVLDHDGDPEAVYVATEPLEHLPLVLLLFLLSYAHKHGHDDRLQSLVKRKRSYPIDGFVVVVGVHTVLKQCHPSYCKQLLAYLGQFVCSTVTAQYADAKQAKDAAPLELVNAIWFVDTLCKVADVPKPTDFIPAAILAMAYKA